MNSENKIHDMSAISDLLFDGLIYRVVSDPNDFLRSTRDMSAFLDFANNKKIDKKIAQFDSAEQIVRQERDKEEALNVFTTFLESSPYGLILVDDDFKAIFSNKKASAIINELFDDGDTTIKLKPQLIDKIGSHCNHDDESQLITLERAIDNTNAYLITNKQCAQSKAYFNVLLIPNTANAEFQLHKSLVDQYNLTKKEKILLTSLIQGACLKEISEQSSVTLNTTRSHLKSIFRKTNTQSQTNLIGLFLNYESQLIDSYLESNISADSAKKSADLALDKDLFVKLKTKNLLCYRDYGPSDGRPLVIFHNTLGSRYHIPYEYEDILDKANRRIIVPERPGYGRSSPVKNHVHLWNEMFLEFADHLALENFDLLGNVLGCSHALEFVNKFPNKVNKVILTSPTFINHFNQAENLGEVAYSCARLTNFSNRIAYRGSRLWYKSMARNAKKHVRRMINDYSGNAEQDAIRDELFIEKMTLNFIESQRNNSKAASSDSIFSFSPRKLDLEKINIPFEIWIGDEDTMITVDGAKQICSPLPNKTFHICKGHSEDVFYHRFEDIIQ